MRQHAIARLFLTVLAMVNLADPGVAQELGRHIIRPGDTPTADSDINCRNGEALKGILCSTKDCDRKTIVCQVYSEPFDSSVKSTREMMDRNNRIELAEFAFGIRDRDNELSMRSLSTDLLVRAGNCQWVGHGGADFNRMCGRSDLVSGVSCSGEFCADLQVRCCRAEVVQTEDDDQNEDSEPETPSEDDDQDEDSEPETPSE